MKTKHFLYAMAMLTVLSISAVSCSSDDDDETGSSPQIQISELDSLGKVITDAEGKTLYFFSKDANGQSSCYDSCSDIWPTYYSESLNVSSGLEASDFDSIERDDGTMQTTYKGWPLYYYYTDAAAGDSNGQGVNDVWFVAKPDYTIMAANGPLLGKNGSYYTTTDYFSYTVADSSANSVRYFTDDYGRTLYIFKKSDSFGVNTFSGNGNDEIWPVYVPESSSFVVPGALSLNVSDFSTTSVTLDTGDEVTQLTYKGWPLYYFGEDNLTRGNTKGISAPNPPESQTGNIAIWPVVNVTTTTAP